MRTRRRILSRQGAGISSEIETTTVRTTKPSIVVARGLASHLRLKRAARNRLAVPRFGRQGAGISSEIETLSPVHPGIRFAPCRQGAGISSEIETNTHRFLSMCRAGSSPGGWHLI